MDAARRRFLSGAPPVPAAVSVHSDCLNVRSVECRLCADVCEPRALRFVPALGGIARLQVNADTCTRCGDCAPLCPVGSIRVAAL